MVYNPFDKPIDKIKKEDLDFLIQNEVAEGYYVEYKGDSFPSNVKIGRSIASFANTYGGWYIVGVKTNDHNEASEISGFRFSENPDPISKIREIIKSHIDPIPLFFIKVVNIKDENGVLIVNIPGEQETPFITKDGRIYRRTFDSSEPIFETNRFSVDRLVDQGKRIHEKFGKFCTDLRTFSKAEESRGWVNIFLSPYPEGQIENFEIRTRAGLEKLLKKSQKPVTIKGTHSEDWGSGTVPFNTGQVTSRSAVMRQVDITKSAYNSLTVELFIDGRAKFNIPLVVYRDWDKRGFNQLKSERIRISMTKMWEKDQEGELYLLNFFDFANLWIALAVLLSFYQDWLEKNFLVTTVRGSIVLDNVWRFVPFLDIDAWGVHIDEFGLPVIHMETVEIPEDISRAFLLDIEKMPFWQVISSFSALGFGIPMSLYADYLRSLQKKEEGV